MESIEQRGVVPAAPEQVWDAFVDGEGHAAMTGASATSDPKVGGRFSAWDGYIDGTHRVLERPHRIVQAWRTQQFPDDAPDSVLEIRLAPVDGGTDVHFVHRDLPDGQGEDYRQGWIDHYLAPMRAYFTKTKQR